MSTLTNVADGIDLSKPLDRLTVAEFWQSGEHILKKLLESHSPQIATKPKKKFVTKKEACEALGNISLVTLDRLTSLGKITAYRPTSDRVVFCLEELEQYVFSTKNNR
jgi:hypothetical protein